MNSEGSAVTHTRRRPFRVDGDAKPSHGHRHGAGLEFRFQLFRPVQQRLLSSLAYAGDGSPPHDADGRDRSAGGCAAGPRGAGLPPRQEAPAGRVPPPAAPSGRTGTYIFQDEFDGPAGSGPDPSKWAVAKARETIKDPTYWERPENIGQYRDNHRNVFLDGNSNLVLRAAKDGPTYFSGKVQSLWRGGVGHTWEAR